MGYIKKELSWTISEKLDELQEKFGVFMRKILTEEIASTAGWDYILSALDKLFYI
ncbi:hypothetical protein QUA89_28810 [Microcoleus sp. F10-B4]